MTHGPRHEKKKRREKEDTIAGTQQKTMKAFEQWSSESKLDILAHEARSAVLKVVHRPV